MKTMTQTTLVVATDRPEGTTIETEQLRVYRAILAATNEALQKFKPVEGTLGGGMSYGCATLVPIGG